MARLMAAGSAVLAERGYRATRVDDIVHRAKTSHGTFYQYFASKDDLVRALAQAAIDDLAAVTDDLGPVDAGDEGRAELRRFVGRFHAVYENHGPVIRAWAENQIDDRAVHRLGQRSFARTITALAERIGESGAACGPDALLSATVLLATVERLVYFVTSRRLGLPVDALLDELAGMLHRGFFTPRQAARSLSS
jgi:AcrR family transcriptional regulator